jgi:hypothetical protein
LEEDQVFGRKVSAVVSAARQLTTRPWNEAKKALLLAFELLDKGESGIVFDGGRYVVKCYPLEDEGYTNFVKTCIRAHQHFSDREWFSHLPKMFMYEEHDNFAVVVMEKLIRYTFIEKTYKKDIQRFVAMVTPKYFSTLHGALHECWGRLYYHGLRQELHLDTAEQYKHYRVNETIDELMVMLVSSCHSLTTCCDLRPDNIMFRRVSRHNFQFVMCDPFCPE